MRIHRGCKRKVVSFVVAVMLFQVLRIHMHRNEDVMPWDHNLMDWAGGKNSSSLTMRSPSSSTSSAPETTSQDPLLALCPDMRGHEEQLLGLRFHGNETRDILAEPWGDPAFKAKMLPLWQKDTTAMSNAVAKMCQKDFTIAKADRNSSYCPCINRRMQGNTDIDFSPPSWHKMAEIYRELGVEQGGTRRPVGCSARQTVAIIIPYKDRLNHLHVLLHHLHKILVRQDMHYRVFVVEQAHPNIFNKAALMDTGFLEAHRLFPFDCVIFHDVDLLLEDDRNLYACVRNQPRHVASNTDKHQYRLPYSSLFGGGTAFPTDMFRRLNGYATVYWGWGGEDDDMYARVTRFLRLKPHRMPKQLARFTMMKHIRDHLFPPNIFKNKLVKDRKGFKATVQENGLSSLKYTVHATMERPLFTWIYAEAHSPLTQFFYREATCNTSRAESQPYYRKEEVLLLCATRCQHEDRCAMFQFQLDKDWRPRCLLYTHDCTDDRTPTLSHSFIFTKGRRIQGSSGGSDQNLYQQAQIKAKPIQVESKDQETKGKPVEKVAKPIETNKKAMETKAKSAQRKG